MIVNKDIFKSYDVRGVFPEELNKETAYKIGRAFVFYSKAKRIAVAYDARLSSPVLYRALIKGIIDQGGDVYELKMAPTEFIYFAVGYYKYDGGIMVTASHNPKEYNGFKMITGEKGNIAIVRGKEILETFEKDLEKSPQKGRVYETDIKEDFSRHVFSVAGKTKPIKAVIDVGNGSAGEVINSILEKTDISFIPINFNPDGNCPSRSPNPLSKGADREIREKIIAEKADVGFMFDGDGDRVFMFDEKGKAVSADISLLFLAKLLLEKNPGSAISYNVICSKAVPHFISKWGGKPVRTPVGFVNVREGIIKEKGVMGGELSGHYCFKDNFYLDSGVIALLMLLRACSEKKVSEMAEEFRVYAKSPQINFQIENKEEVLKKIKKEYSDGKQDYLDGVTVEYNTWWFNVRASQTEPLLRLTIEADTEEILEEKKKELIRLATPYSS